MTKGRGRPKGNRDDLTVKLARAIVEEARFVVLDRGSTLAEYLSERLRESVHKDYLEAIARRSKASAADRTRARRGGTGR